MNNIDWNKIFSYYNSIKKLYIECEETDPDLKTNLQPLNEFRAALDYLMRIVAIEKIDEYKSEDADLQADKLLSHLRRAFYDICDMLSVNYRNKIVDALENYSSENITAALPNYYSEIRPDIEELSNRIAKLRLDNGFNKADEENHIQCYMEIINKLKEYYQQIIKVTPSLEELKKREKKTKRKNIITQYIIPIVSVVVAVVSIIIGVCVWSI